MKRYNLKFTLKTIAAVTFIISGWMNVSAVNLHCANDSTLILNLVRENYTPGGNPGSLAGKIAESFIGSRVEEVTKNDSTGHLFLRADAFDDLNFLNTVSSIARLATSPGHKRINEYEAELENVSYRRGKDAGFPSRMIYISDWVVDNKSRNIIAELTENYSDQFRTKSLEKISHEREKYAALKDSAVFENQKMVEMGFRTHKIPHLKREYAGYKDVTDEMRDGDIIVLLNPEKDMDVLEIGFIRKRDDGFHFIHPSKEADKIVEEKETLDRYLKRNAKRTYGWRWLRLRQ